MQDKRFLAAAAVALAICGAAHADEPENNAVRIGYAKVRFNLQSGDLTGPPGTTPPGLKIDAKDLDVFAISYERRLGDNWAAQLQAGIPPTLTAVGAGVAAPVGTVAKARIWFPTAMVRYTIPGFSVVRPYVAGGVTYTFFTEQESSPGYNAAVQGAGSSIDLKSSWGAYGRVGLEYPLDKQWCINVEFSSFHLKTTATVDTQTPGFGTISRHVDLKDAPRIFGATIGYRF
ncbi:OmpW family protein [Duganella sp. LX20W]|uniref:OmpW family protein n=1 Tax=Rugamonas brunnea TaxID=2758569 RepID=A0A7W2IEI2_9BURK|nr:OmpW family outer membrane protein [Rugamonas brunnea]MBA5640092.1 OmpW family protein [Rugamonas brunnea]